MWSSREGWRRTVGALLLVLGTAGLAVAQPAAPPPGQDAKSAKSLNGLLRSDLSLEGRTVTLAVDPALRAADPSHRRFFSPDGSPDARARLGHLVIAGAVRIGALDVPAANPAGQQFDVWIETTADGWGLEIADARAPESPKVIGDVVLDRKRLGGGARATLLAALIPATENTGRLVLQWGEFEAAADLLFTDPVARRPPAAPPNTLVNRRHDEDTTAVSRVIMLSQRSETALVTPKGARFSVTFARSFKKGRTNAATAATGVTSSLGLGVDGRDFAKLMSTSSGAVVELSESGAPRLSISSPVRFGKALLRPGNQGPGYPGAYGMWLKRVGTGWRLVFNNEPDAWGTQHDPKLDAGEIPLTYSKDGAPERPFGVALVPSAADRGRLVIIWGPHEWSTDFTIGG